MKKVFLGRMEAAMFGVRGGVATGPMPNHLSVYQSFFIPTFIEIWKSIEQKVRY